MLNKLCFTKPRCPKCGEPPCSVKGVAVVDMTIAPVLKRSNDRAGDRFALAKPRSVTKFVLSEFTDQTVTLVCGGGHE